MASPCASRAAPQHHMCPRESQRDVRHQCKSFFQIFSKVGLCREHSYSSGLAVSSKACSSSSVSSTPHIHKPQQVLFATTPQFLRSGRKHGREGVKGTTDKKEEQRRQEKAAGKAQPGRPASLQPPPPPLTGPSPCCQAFPPQPRHRLFCSAPLPLHPLKPRGRSVGRQPPGVRGAAASGSARRRPLPRAR